MSETSQERSLVAGPPEPCAHAPTAPPHSDLVRALAELRSARRAAAAAATAPGLRHDVDLAEWRLNRLLERHPLPDGGPR